MKRFPLFYLILATGGALAGLCASVIFPAILTRTYEFLAAVVVVWIIGILCALSRQELVPRIALVATALIPVFWMIRERSVAEHDLAPQLVHVRNYYGAMTISDSLFVTSVSSDTTLHGVQIKGENSREPTSYYTRGSGLGLVLTELQKYPASLRLGVIGLGAGTVAAYVRPQDNIVFWEINPLATQIAYERFTFLKECPGANEVRMIDGRLGVRKDPGVFDVLVVDAFSGDSIPAHLLTIEAISEYLAKLNDSGFLIVHISNRYFDLMPVLASAASDAGWNITSISAQPPASSSETSHATATIYAIFYPDARKTEFESLITAALSSETIRYDVTSGSTVKPLRWTDERHAVFDALLE